MTQPAVTTDGRPLVGSYGDVYTAPVGTAAPADIEAPAAPWVLLGLISEDGATWAPPTEETTDIGAWQTPYPVRILTTSLTTTVQFQLMEWDRETLPFALGGGTFDDTGVDSVVYHPPGAGESEERAIFIKVLDEPVAMGIYYPKGRVQERGDAVFRRDEAALLDVTFGIIGDPVLEPYNLIFAKDAFPVAVTGTLAQSEPTEPEQPEPVAA